MNTRPLGRIFKGRGQGRVKTLVELIRSFFSAGEQGVWYDPSDINVNWRTNLLTYSQQFDNAAWTKSNSFVQTNLLTYSQDFDNAAWTKANATVTANTVTAPDGSITADKLVEDTATSSHFINQDQSITTGVTYTQSVYAKAGERTVLQITGSTGFDSVYANFDLTNGVLGSTDGGAATIVAVGGGWYRCTYTLTATSTGAGRRMLMAMVQSASSTRLATYTGNGTSGIYIWGAQLVQGSVPGDYRATTSTALPALYTSPVGSLTAEKLVEDAASSLHRISQVSTVVSGSAYTLSAYFKAGEKTTAGMGLYDGTTFVGRANFDLTGAGTATVVSGSAGISNVGGGWYRCWVQGSPASASVTSYINAGSVYSYQGDGTSGVYLWGAQLQTGSAVGTYQTITDGVADYYVVQSLPILFQDSAGTTPVTALEQPVGLMLDKSKGLTLGSELVTNGDFSQGSTGWTVPAGWAISGGQAVATAVSSSFFGGGATTVQNRFYKIEFDVVSYTSGTLYVTVGANYTTPASLTSITPGKKSVLVSAGANASRGVEFYGGAITTTIDNISVKELPGNHAYQGTSAARPVLSGRYNLLTKTEQFDDAAWTKTAASVSANATAAPDGTITADNVVFTTGSGQKYVSSSATVLASAQYNLSLYAKTSGIRYLAIYASGSTTNSTAYFDLQLGTVSQVGGTGTQTASIQSVGNGWYLCTLTRTNDTGTNMPIEFHGATTSGSLTMTGDGTSGIYLWGADLRVANDGQALPVYQRVNTSTDYDTVGFPLYIKPNGSSQFMVTNSIPFDQGATNAPLSSEMITNGDFGSATGWTAGTNWAISGGLATHTAGAQGYLDALTPGDFVTGNIYKVVLTVTRSAGTLYVYVKGALAATVTASQTVTVYIAAGSSSVTGLRLDADSLFAGTVDNVSVKRLTDTAYAPDRVTVWAGLRKLSDAGNSVLYELSADLPTNNGTFDLFAPIVSGGLNTYSSGIKGTSTSSAGTGAVSYAAPATHAVSVSGGISTQANTLRINGALAASSTTSQGTGNFGNYPLYLFARGGTSLWYGGRFTGLIVRGAQSTAQQIAIGEKFMASKVGFKAPTISGVPTIGESS